MHPDVTKGGDGAGVSGQRSSRLRMILRFTLSILLLVAIFAGAIPRFASYSDALRNMAHVSPTWWVLVALMTVCAQVGGVWVYQAALPGLRFFDGLTEIETTSAIASTVPGGGAVAIGMTYRMFTSFGFGDVPISAAIMVTGIWNLGAKFSLPIVAVALLAVTTHPPAVVTATAVLGVIVMAAAGVGLWFVLRSERMARSVGSTADRLVNRVRRRRRPRQSNDNRIERALADFRSRVTDIVRLRGWRLTAVTLADQAFMIVLVLFIVRAVGISPGRVGFAAVLTSFALARFAGAVPITPGGLGTLDSAFIGTLAAFGAKTPQALAADLLWRACTYLLPIILGTVTYLLWIRREASRRQVPSVP